MSISDLIARLAHAPVRVLAGPGTGKTYALMQGVTALLQADVAPTRIHVSTFTRTAAADLRKGIAQIATFGAADIVAGTLHGYAFGVLGREHVFHITNRVPRPLLEFEGRFLLADLTGFGGLRERADRLQAFNAAWARLQSDDPGWPQDPVDQAFHTALLAWLGFHKAMLVGEIVPLCLNYLRNNPAAPELSSFDHVLVDEYQDLNRAEQALLDKLAEQASSAVIGDPDQSIYSFKFAHPAGILEYPASHAGTEEAGLTECRRCPKRVVRIANSLIAKNTVKSTAPLVERPANIEGELHIVQWATMEDEAREVARLIKRRLDAGAVKAGDILVLAPRRQFGYAVRNALRNTDVHAHSFFNEEALDGNPRVIDESAAQQTFTLLTLLARPDDAVALRCWMGYGSSSLRERGWREIRKRSESAGESPRDVLEELRNGGLHLPYTSDLVERYNALLALEADCAGLIGSALANKLYPDDLEWAEPFRAVAEANNIATFTPGELLDLLTTAVTRPELPTDVEYVRVMSLHKSKGLTAKLVVVVGCIEGLVPTLRTDKPIDQQKVDLEEQRRLFYVALTRTQHVLVLSSIKRIKRDLAWKIGAQVPHGFGTFAPALSSRFFAELGPSAPPATTSLP
jgi:superfamily I DNA/RNA helicase